jgi:hypothetical protein
MESQTSDNLPKAEISSQTTSNLCKKIFGDPEATRNLVGFFDLALKVHMRIHPELYQQDGDAKKHD